MKKILIAAYTLDIGGIEKALINLINELIKKYDITLVLERKKGIYLNEIDSNIKVIEYKPNNNKNAIIRKTINIVKRAIFILKNKNKYDFAASFATYSKMGSFCARTASKNNALWVHTDYLAFYKNDENKMREFFEFIKYEKFENIVCVGDRVKKSFEKVLGEKNNIYVINNFIDYVSIEQKAKDKIEIKKDNNITTFLNVSRHEEESKRLTRLIECAEKLKEENQEFRVVLIGNGKDYELYRDLVKQKGLSQHIIFLGYKENPYPYFKIADALLLTSEYEGYPVVFNEAMVLGLPILTTDVSDAKIDIDGKFGIVVEKNIEDIYNAMKRIIEKNSSMNNKFDAEKFNKGILKKLELLIEGENNAQN